MNYWFKTNLTNKWLPVSHILTHIRTYAVALVYILSTHSSSFFFFVLFLSFALLFFSKKKLFALFIAYTHLYTIHIYIYIYISLHLYVDLIQHNIIYYFHSSPCLYSSPNRSLRRMPLLPLKLIFYILFFLILSPRPHKHTHTHTPPCHKMHPTHTKKNKKKKENTKKEKGRERPR